MTVTRGVLYDTVSGGLLYDAATGGVLYDNSGVYRITQDDYYTRNQPAKSEELKNRVQVRYSPLVDGEPDTEVYRSDEPISLAAGASVTIDAEYSTVPCIDAIANVDNETGSTFSVTAKYYSWGARVVVTNTGALAGTCELFVEATPLTVEGESFAPVAEDAASIAENGVQEYSFPDSHLIQSEAMAALIGPALLASFATPRKDVSINWRGDPALELGDEISVPIYQRNLTTIQGEFYIFKIKTDFDGTLRQTTEGRILQ